MRAKYRSKHTVSAAKHVSPQIFAVAGSSWYAASRRRGDCCWLQSARLFQTRMPEELRRYGKRIIDLLIDNARFILTQDRDRTLLQGASIAVKGNRIAAIGDPQDLKTKYLPGRVISGWSGW